VSAPRRWTAALVALLAVLAAALAGCGGAGSGRGEDRTLTVLAAASLTESFTALAHDFEASHPAVDVRLTFDSSATLAQQVVAGAPGDVLATADARTMHQVVKAGGTASAPQPFASNRLVVVVPPGNPAEVTGLDDLSRDDVTLVMCDPAAPCGALARTVLRDHHVHAHARSLEVDVKAVLTKVELGEADAGLVYASDAETAGGKVRAFAVPPQKGEVNTYLVAPLEQADAAGLARAWVRLVRSAHGRRVLHDAGFGAP
jgi:molybdate transport system substrate-binding protein